MKPYSRFSRPTASWLGYRLCLADHQGERIQLVVDKLAAGVRRGPGHLDVPVYPALGPFPLSFDAPIEKPGPHGLQGAMPATPPMTDADIRPALRRRLLAPHSGDADTVLLEELGLCRGLVRVDLALVNGSIHGYEIKSDRDSLRRLKGQVGVYSKVLDRATLVATPRHLDEATAIIPDWWGILRADPGKRGPRLLSVRRPRRNPERDPRTLVELLWQDASLALLQEHGAARGVRGKPRRFVWDRICTTLDLETIAAAVRTQLKARATQPDHP